MKTKYFTENEYSLLKIDFENNTFEHRYIDEHTLECSHYTQNVNNAEVFFDLLKNTCNILFIEIDEIKYLDMVHSFDDLIQSQNVIKNLKLQYAEKMKNYLNKFC